MTKLTSDFHQYTVCGIGVKIIKQSKAEWGAAIMKRQLSQWGRGITGTAILRSRAAATGCMA
jgi:hypothetical protein